MLVIFMNQNANSTFDRVFQFLLRHKDFCIKLISQYYPLSYNELEKYRDKLNWVHVGYNEVIDWNYSLYDLYKDKVDMEILGHNNRFPFTEAIIEKHFDELFYSKDENGKEKTFFSENKGLPWSEKLIDKYIEDWDWSYLSSNESIPFTYELLEKYRERWDRISLRKNNSVHKLFSDDINVMETKGFLKLAAELGLFKYPEHYCIFCNKGIEAVLKEKNIYSAALHAANCKNFIWNIELYRIMKESIDLGIYGINIILDLNHNDNFVPDIDVFEILEDVWHYDYSLLFPSTAKFLINEIIKNNALESIMGMLPEEDYVNRRYTIEIFGPNEEDSQETKPIIKKEKTAEEHRVAAVKHAQREKYADAIANIAWALELEPTNAQIFSSYGFIHIRMNNFDKAINKLDKAIDLDESKAQFFALRGYAKYLSGKVEEWKLDIAIAKELNDKLYFLYYDNAIDSLYENNYGMMKVSFEIANLLNPEIKELRYNLELLKTK